ncbi:hypothetical protein BH09GEM1_BH09GEM1_09290 [soil metagenome]
MTNPDIALFLSGVLAGSYAIAALFFLKFWRQTRDRLFAYFSAAFGLLVVQRIVLGFTVGARVDPGVYYLVRLAAFLLILVAIVEKNRAER